MSDGFGPNLRLWQEVSGGIYSNYIGASGLNVFTPTLDGPGHINTNTKDANNAPVGFGVIDSGYFVAWRDVSQTAALSRDVNGLRVTNISGNVNLDIENLTTGVAKYKANNHAFYDVSGGTTSVDVNGLLRVNSFPTKSTLFFRTPGSANVPATTVACPYIIEFTCIGGGGGGGHGSSGGGGECGGGGGGGSGCLLKDKLLIPSSTTFQFVVNVGSGGNGGIPDGAQATNGANTTLTLSSSTQNYLYTAFGGSLGYPALNSSGGNGGFGFCGGGGGDFTGNGSAGAGGGTFWAAISAFNGANGHTVYGSGGGGNYAGGYGGVFESTPVPGGATGNNSAGGGAGGGTNGGVGGSAGSLNAGLYGSNGGGGGGGAGAIYDTAGTGGNGGNGYVLIELTPVSSLY
jgi:hypothetical protein